MGPAWTADETVIKANNDKEAIPIDFRNNMAFPPRVAGGGQPAADELVEVLVGLVVVEVAEVAVVVEVWLEEGVGVVVIARVEDMVATVVLEADDVTSPSGQWLLQGSRSLCCHCGQPWL